MYVLFAKWWKCNAKPLIIGNILENERNCLSRQLSGEQENPCTQSITHTNTNKHASVDIISFLTLKKPENTQDGTNPLPGGHLIDLKQHCFSTCVSPPQYTHLQEVFFIDWRLSSPVYLWFNPCMSHDGWTSSVFSHTQTFHKAYLLHASAAGASERHSVPTVVIGCHRGHAVILVHVKWDALDGAGAPERLIEVLAAEVIIYLQRLVYQGDRKKEKRLMSSLILF